MNRYSRSSLVLCVGVLLPGAATADDGPFRCGSRIIDNGMTLDQVFQACGAPTSQRVEYRDVRSANNRVLGTTEIQRWTYAAYSATRVLVFVDDRLQSIERF